MADISKLNLTGSDLDIKDSVARQKLTVVDPDEGEGLITFGVDANGNYGYKKVGANIVTPFSNGGGGVERTTLWTNPDTSLAISGDISLSDDVRDYDYLEISFYDNVVYLPYNTCYRYTQIFRSYNESEFRVSLFALSRNYGSPYTAYRGIKFAETIATLQDAFNPSNVDNKYLVPMSIIGIKV